MSERTQSAHLQVPWQNAEYWQGRFSLGDTPWELGSPSIVLMQAYEELTQSGFDIRGKTVLCPGCGSGSDAIKFAKMGAKVIAVDWSKIAIDKLTELVKIDANKISGTIDIKFGDFFKIDIEPIDLVCEHTFFCAIDPKMRGVYIERLASVIKPGGYLIGNFFVLSDEEAARLNNLSLAKDGFGPPFATTVNELEILMKKKFKTIALYQANQGEPTRRPGMEWVGILQA